MKAIFIIIFFFSSCSSEINVSMFDKNREQASSSNTEIAINQFSMNSQAGFDLGNYGGNSEWSGSGVFSREWSGVERELQANDSYIDTTNLVALWHLNEAGGTIIDASSSGLDSISESATTSYQEVGVLNGALGFDSASSEYIDFGDISAVENLSAITISVWMKRSSLSAPVLIGRQDGGGFNSIAIEVYSDGYVYFGLGDELGIPDYGRVRSDDTEWHHYVLVFDGTQAGDSLRLKGYIDGEEQTLEYNGTIPTTTRNSPSPFYIGRISGDYSDGWVDEVIIWSRPLDSAEVKKLYLRQKGSFGGGEVSTYTSQVFDSVLSTQWTEFAPVTKAPYGKEIVSSGDESSTYSAGENTASGLVGHWRLNDSLGNVSDGGAIIDSSPSGFDATIEDADQSMSYVEGRIGNALSATGATDDSIVLDDPSIFAGLSQGSIAAWVKWDGGTSANIIFSSSDGTGTGGFEVFYSANNRFNIWTDTGCSGGQFHAHVVVPSPQNWHHLVYTVDGSSHKFYVDGVENTNILYDNGDPSRHSFFGDCASGTVYEIGGVNGPAGTEQFDGLIDDIAVWNRPLTPSEVQSLYQRGIMRIKHQVRVCDQSDCSDGTFIGYDGSPSTFFEEYGSNSYLPLVYDLNSLNLNGRYFQFRSFFESHDSTIRPELRSVTLGNI